MNLTKLLLAAIVMLVAAVSSTGASARTAGSTSGSDLSWPDVRSFTSVEQMDEYFEFARREVIRFNRETGIAPPKKWRFVKSGRDITTPCTGDWVIPSSELFMYCHGNGTVYAGADKMWEFYQISWIAPAFALEHEAAHSQQWAGDRMNFWMQALNEVSVKDSRKLEHQADCASGVWTAWAERQPDFGLAVDQDEIIKLMNRIGDDPRAPEFMQRHGNSYERAYAYYAGYSERSLRACDEMGFRSLS